MDESDNDESQDNKKSSSASKTWKRALGKLKRIFAKKYKKNPPEKLINFEKK